MVRLAWCEAWLRGTRPAWERMWGMAEQERRANPVIWFEIPVLEMDRARKFYRDVLGFDLEARTFGPLLMAFFPMERDKAGAGGALVKADGYIPAPTGTRMYFSVGDIEPTLEKVVQAGGKVVREKTSIGEYGFVADFLDTEGNLISLHSM